MIKREQAWPVSIAIVLFCGGLIVALWSWRSRDVSIADWQSAFPPSVHTFLYVDVAALSQTGLLSRLTSSGTAEAEYVGFVKETAFDYQRDLRSVLMGFDGQSTYALASGSFDWRALKKYAEAHHGACRSAVCRVSGSAKDRSVSYGPFNSGTLAFSAGPDQWPVLHLLGTARNRRPAILLQGPLWLSTTGSALMASSGLPEGAKTYAIVLAPAERIELALVPSQELSEMSLELRAVCDGPEVAQRVARDLGALTAALNSMLRQDGKAPSPNDLSGVLAGGTFHTSGPRVDGRWPLPRPFLERMIASAQ